MTTSERWQRNDLISASLCVGYLQSGKHQSSNNLLHASKTDRLTQEIYQRIYIMRNCFRQHISFYLIFYFIRKIWMVSSKYNLIYLNNYTTYIFWYNSSICSSKVFRYFFISNCILDQIFNGENGKNFTHPLFCFNLW